MSDSTPPVHTYPLVDPRTSAEVHAQLSALVATATGWEPGTRPDGGDALVSVAAMYADIVRDRLNRSLHNHEIAFLNLIGAGRRSSQPARVPVTFALTPGAESAVVPQGVRVEAAPAVDGEDPIVFETDGVVAVSSALPVEAILHAVWNDDVRPDGPGISIDANGALDGTQQVDMGELATSSPYGQVSIQLALPDLNGATACELSLALDWDKSAGGDLEALGLRFFHRVGTEWRLFEDDEVTSETTAFGVRSAVLRPAGGFSVSTLRDQESVWIGAGLRSGPDGGHGALRSVDGAWAFEIHESRNGARSAWLDGLEVDLTVPFRMLGDRPSASVPMLVELDRAIANETSILITETRSKSTGATLQWEVLTAQGWRPFDDVRTISSATSESAEEPREWQLTAPADSIEAEFNGRTAHWVRLRLLSGELFADARPELGEDGSLIGFSQAVEPPMIEGLTVQYKSRQRRPVTEVVVSAFGQRLEQEPPIAVRGGEWPNSAPALYLRLSGPLRPGPVSFFVELAELSPDELTPERAKASSEVERTIDWQVLVQDHSADPAWISLAAADETEGWSRSGLVSFLVPDAFDHAATPVLGRNGHWLRAVIGGGDLASAESASAELGSAAPSDVVSPRIERISFNTTWATAGESVVSEVLGSSDSRPGQQFTTQRTPVLAGCTVEIDEDQSGSASTSSDDESTVTSLWTEVTSFAASGGTDRHFTLDHDTGQLRFGDGIHGAIPPRGIHNIAINYRTGGGTKGNVAPGSEVETAVSLPYIETVELRHRGRFGTDEESPDHVMRYGPSRLRNRGRAVAVADYADLIYEHFPEVAKAVAVPDLRSPTEIFNSAEMRQVRQEPLLLVVVPRGTDAQPRLSGDLLARIRTFISEVAPTGAEFLVSGPYWRPLDVVVGVDAINLDQAATITDRVQSRVRRWLHPVTGAFDGFGWEFGQVPHESDLFRAIFDVTGVDRVHRPAIVQIADPPAGVDRFLPTSMIYPGSVTVELGPLEIA